MKRLYLLAVLAGLGLAGAQTALGFGADPFRVDASQAVEGDKTLARISFTIPAAHFLYADEIKVTAAGAELAAMDIPDPLVVMDKFSGEEKRVYKTPMEFVYELRNVQAGSVELTVGYQGCDDHLCYFPQKKKFSLAVAARAAPAAGPAVVASATAAEPETAERGSWDVLVQDFSVASQAAGYLNEQEFLKFLGREGGAAAESTALADFKKRGVLLTVVLLLLGGVALNLTPCVLPLIPINLAILGAGSKARSKGQGFVLGALYGLAMALVYGSLGLVVVLTGAKFGALNASITFNVVIAGIFVVLALAMFDLISIDLSRFQGRVGTSSSPGRGSYVAAFSLGAVAALLAGACVAPVLIYTLLLAGLLYSEGIKLALALPFLLGLGMGLPWPFAGAGLTVLPKPGKWMNYVKYAFGVLILGFAFYYGHIGYGLWKARQAGDTASSSVTVLEDALRRAKVENKNVFIDFWATWCKNCLAMEASTFKAPAVEERLKEFIVVKFQAEQPSESPANEILTHFNAIGLPTYVVLELKSSGQ